MTDALSFVEPKLPGGYGWGYRSHGVLGTVLVIILILYLLGHL